ncbi:MAG: CRISPR-associated protein Cas4 [Methanobrevibacter sp.]|uniref:CRISPR-associated protein Cas4 n=1 Tax=Methanobrevibacter sp. TaxID=66852 RepID=UPI003EFFC6E4
MENKKITGVMVQYYVTCKRELWFYSHQINMNYNNEDISIGKLIHERSYSRENKEVKVDNMVFDYIKNDGDLKIFEMKKSSKLSIGAKYQLYFYLYNLKDIEPNAKGILIYPKERKKEEVILTDEIIKEMDDILEGIIEIINLEIPPKAKKMPYCKRCSFYELCMV